MTTDDDFDDDLWADAPSVTVWVTDAEPIGTILGPEGEPLHTVFELRPPFGFSREA